MSRFILGCCLLVVMVLGLSGCQTVHFYQQAIVGQTSLLLQRQKNTEVLASDTADPALKDRLVLAGEIIDYAAAAGLPVDGAYQSYVETGQPFIIWNVFAARPLALALQTSCFPVAGCVSYRGYFKREDAYAYADTLRADGFEVYVGGVAAYSTLGWFEDPLLDTFLFRSEDRLAALLFHELAHRLVYIQDDTRFNESLATAVERYLLKEWLTQREEAHLYEAFIRSQKRQNAVLALIETTRVRLRALYESDVPRHEKYEKKSRYLADLVDRYEALAASWAEGQEYRSWMSSPINNAKLETVADYNEWVPVMTAFLDQHGLTRFKARMQMLAEMDAGTRRESLLMLNTGNTHVE